MGYHRTGHGRAARSGVLHLRTRRRKVFATVAVTGLVLAGTAITSSAIAQTNSPAALPFEVQSLDGSGNNRANPDWGLAGNDYSRVADASYADGIGEPVAGPNPRVVTNRIINDSHQNLFSERNVTQWGFAWGQFLDHTFGLRLGRSPDDPDGEQAPIPFDPNDPIEEFENDLGVIGFERSAISPGTGVDTPREQVNTVSSYIDAWAVYGGTEERLEWLRDGSVDGEIGNNEASLLLPEGYLPRAFDRGDPATAPEMEIGGRLTVDPTQAAVAGDIRANENIALTATHTLFAREHNRIVSLLPDSLSEEEKFQIARRVVIAEQQFITYNEFLPAMGVTLPAYAGYKPTINTDLSNEFATVGYRAHSFIHGELELATNLDRYSPEDLAALEELGVEIEQEEGATEGELIVALNLAFFNPDLLELLQLGPMLQGLGLEAQYKNDEQIDNQLRSVLFQIPVEGNPDCLDGPELPACFDGVNDLGAIDIARGLDHGIPSYNDLREAYGLEPKASFTEVTGEDTAEFPPGLGIDDPASLVFTELFDIDGNPIDLEDEEAVDGEARFGVRATTLAARLQALYGSVDDLDPFTGMIAEQHVPGTDFGELQLAIWSREFANLRDGDRFFYGNNPALNTIRQRYGIDFRTNLGDVIARNTDIPRDEMNGNVFLAADEEPTACEAAFEVVNQWADGFIATVSVTNTGSTTVNGWEMDFRFPTGQVIQDSWNARFSQSGPDVTVGVPAGNWQGTLAPGDTATGWMRASWDRATNARPTHYTMNSGRCTT
jgi:Animal haem peroxidase/Cellulose binding domain